jgi:hypothetical protein
MDNVKRREGLDKNKQQWMSYSLQKKLYTYVYLLIKIWPNILIIKQGFVYFNHTSCLGTPLSMSFMCFLFLYFSTTPTFYSCVFFLFSVLYSFVPNRPGTKEYRTEERGKTQE